MISRVLLFLKTAGAIEQSLLYYFLNKEIFVHFCYLNSDFQKPKNLNDVLPSLFSIHDIIAETKPNFIIADRNLYKFEGINFISNCLNINLFDFKYGNFGNDNKIIKNLMNPISVNAYHTIKNLEKFNFSNFSHDMDHKCDVKIPADLISVSKGGFPEKNWFQNYIFFSTSVIPTRHFYNTPNYVPNKAARTNKEKLKMCNLLREFIHRESQTSWKEWDHLFELD